MGRPTAAEAAAALSESAAGRAALAAGIATPSWFATSMGVAIAIQIATTAFGVGESSPWTLLAGLALFVAVAGIQLARFRRLNGVWLGGFASRVVLGTGTAASVSYSVALGLAIWAAYADRAWAVVLLAVAGGAAYALSGRRWLRAYRTAPAVHGRGESAVYLAALALMAIGGLVVLALDH